MERISKIVLEKYVNEGFLKVCKHPSLPLQLVNYTNKTQYEAFWNAVTLKCRALVTDESGNIVSKGFSKFFNYSEGKTNIPDVIDWVRVYEKLDGSYIGLFYYDGQWIVNSKGSFTSDQVVWAKEILESKDLSVLNKTWTYCFELIVPENRIVVAYGDKKDLVFLRAFHTESGTEIDLHKIHGFNHVDSWLESNFNPKKLQELNTPNEEGFVVQFSNGERCKIKFEEYMRLHRIVTNTTSYDIWDCLRNNDGFEEILNRIPDEFYNWVRETKEGLERKFNNILTEIKAEYKTICLSLGNCSDKQFALFVKGNKHQHYLFALRNGRDISDNIWKSIKPTFKKAFQK